MKSKRTKRLRNGMLQLFTLLLLFFYIAGAAPFNVFHESGHGHASAINHSDEDENDPCHRAIYHNDQQGCAHDSHITISHKCNICDLACHVGEGLLNDSLGQATVFGENSFTNYKLNLESYGAVVSSSRAPPVLG